MILHVEAATGDYDGEIDLEALVNGDNVTNEASAHMALVIKVAQFALGAGVSFDDVEPKHIDDGSGEDLDVSGNDDWILEVAQLAYFLKVSIDRRDDEDKYYAYINGNGWKWTDFDALKGEVEDNFHQELENDDYEEFGKEYMSEYESESIPDHLEKYFDFEEYGRDEAGEYNSYEWNGKTFLFNN